MTAFWDDKEMFPSGEYMKFDSVGDSIHGTITAIRRHMFDDGSVAPQITLDTAEGPRTVTCGQVRLKAALAEKRPGVGDVITITLDGIEKRAGGKTLKLFTVVVGPAAPAPTPPATPAAAPRQQFTPEMVAAMKNMQAQGLI